MPSADTSVPMVTVWAPALLLIITLKTWYPDIDVTVYLEPIPNIFKFMARSNEIVSDFSGDTVYDLFIAQDCGDTGRLGGAAHFF